jgi:mono/diheme cytochrome c family protein
MTTLMTILGVVLLFAFGAVGVLWSGSLSVSALNSTPPLIEWAVHSVVQRSVRAQASSIQAPTNLKDRAAQGATDFHEMCVQCHGAPGKERGEVGQGLNPRPPSLSDAAPGWTPSELFWIVKNGIRMTGMPALGPTHEDDRIWAIISFVEQLPSMTPAEYQQRQSPSPRGAPHPHEHHGDHHEHAH